ncbi:MAG: hypothetical protein LBR32_08710 [Propionibacteriaceae bacterium]|jgi:hypothetical protein|nr:hypothetical protein [Propionibacteriaceae bacterium]
MPKRPSKHLRTPRPLGNFARTETKADGQWLVNSVPEGHSHKTYRCPGCDHEVPPGAAHLVVWPVEPGVGSSSAVAERRHWHTSCWRRRR